jgi:NAD(P)-dependent dehydrogenase (short-subunit alcohol dehydrogenase family)
MSVVVVGASGGIGRAWTSILSESPAVARITACSRSGPVPDHAKVSHQRLDLEDEETSVRAADAVRDAGALDLVLVASGILHEDEVLRPEKTWRTLDGAALERVFRINAVGPALVAKHFLPLLARDRKSVFAALSARVGSISDNRLGGWHAYRASKAALNMLVRTFAIELARRNRRAICVGLHPGTVDTGLSAPFQGNIAEGKLFTPDFAAARLLEVVDRLTQDDSGNVFAWDGQLIPA